MFSIIDSEIHLQTIKNKDDFYKLEKLVIDYFPKGDPSHDLLHLRRVLDTSIHLSRLEGGDLRILIPAVLLHDIVNVPKNSSLRKEASRMAAEKACELLSPLNFSNLEIEGIAQAITEHSYSRGLSPSSKESAILQDADRLDALGAIGFMRMVACGSMMGNQFYEYGKDLISLDVQRENKYVIDHFFIKLIKLPNLMNFSWSKSEAMKRVELMKNIIHQLSCELSQCELGTEVNAPR